MPVFSRVLPCVMVLRVFVRVCVADACVPACVCCVLRIADCVLLIPWDVLHIADYFLLRAYCLLLVLLIAYYLSRIACWSGGVQVPSLRDFQPFGVHRGRALHSPL